MSSVDNVLIAGGGTAGLALAILLSREGVSVDVVEVLPDVARQGSGITLQGNALRCLRQLGIWEEVLSSGFPFDTLGIRSPAGDLLVELSELRTGGADLPATMGMRRPQLAAVMSDAARRAGAKITFATSVAALTQDDLGVDVVFDDGRGGRYDLVVGADGIRSKMRAMIGIDVDPQLTGMAIWRLDTSRPATIVQTDLIYGGPCYIAGYCPTGPDSIYAYLVERSRPRSSFTYEETPALMRGLAAGYHGEWDTIRAGIDDPARINHTQFESLLVDRPWHRGRVVLIGDAAHACPPTLAQGAAMALEDAVVLAELLLGSDHLDVALWDGFMDRRFDRARTVVHASVQLGQWLLDDTPQPDVPGLMGNIAAMLSQPA